MLHLMRLHCWSLPPLSK